MNKKLAWTVMLGAFSLASWAQEAVTVKGTVIDSEDNPVIGATIVVKGTTTGTTTDLDGNYTISVVPGQELEFSYVGMQASTIKVGDQHVINVKMADGEQLDELVVIGYGTVKKSHLTGAVSSVSGKDLQANVARSVSSALQGRVAGVTVSSPSGQPGEGLKINIRGISSLENTDPLYVIDGVYGDINMVDPADIQSIEVLKDASAAAIYGSRAANGVVLITTKGGRLETPTKVTVDAYTGVQTVAKYIDVMDGNQLRDFAKATGFSSAEGLLNWNGGAGTDWQRELYENAMVSKVNLNVSGGNKTSTYNISGSYLNQEGIVKTTGYEAWNLRAKNTFSLFKNHVRLGSTIMMKFWDKDYDDVGYTAALTAVPQWKPYDDNGEWGQAPSWTKGDNPVGWAEAYDRQKHGLDILLNGYAEVDLGLKGLFYKFNVGINRLDRRNYDYSVPYVFSTSSQNPDYNLSEGYNTENDWLIENTINYNNTFGKHTVSAVVGYSAQKNTYRSFGASREKLPEGLSVIGAGDVTTQSTSGEAWTNALVSIFGRVMYSYDNRYLFSASVRSDGSSKFADGYRYGTFPSASVGWNIMNEKFFENAKEVMNEFKVRASYGVLGNLNGIGNYDTQSIVTTGRNTVQGSSLWIGGSTGIAWVSPQDVTWEKTKTTNVGVDLGFFQGKLDLSADYFIQKTEDMLLSMPQPDSYGLKDDPVMNAGTVENKGLELSLNHQNTVGEFYYHAGLNLTFIKNELTKVNGTRDEWTGFNPHGKGAITYAKPGHSIGFFNLIESDGVFNNQEEIDAYVDQNGNKIQPDAVPGDLKFVDANGDGKIDDLDRVDCGSAFPKVTMGLTLGAAWRGIDLNLFFDGNFGNKIYNAQYFSTVYNESTGNQYARRINAWTENNPNTDEPRYVAGVNGTNMAYTDRWLEDGSFFRLKTLELGYTLPKAWTQKAWLSSVRIYTAMENLFTITSYSGYTPDLGVVDSDGAGTSGGSGVMTRGCDDGRYPSARTFTFGLQVNF